MKGRDLHTAVSNYKRSLADAVEDYEQIKNLEHVECVYKFQTVNSWEECARVISINAPATTVLEHMEGTIKKYEVLLSNAVAEYQRWVISE